MDVSAERLPGSLFTQPFWLQAVAPDSWDRVIIKESNQLVAHMPYVYRRERGSKVIAMPPLTQTLGPWFKPHPGKYVGRLSYEKRMMNALIDGLPEFSYFSQNFHHSVQNWLPFYWKGFEQTTRYTYVLEDLTDLEQIWRNAKGNTRTDIRKARQSVAVRDDLGVDAFLDLNEMTFKRQGRSLPYSRDLVRSLDAVCKEHECRRILFAEDADGVLHAAAYIVWDDDAAYYLMGGADPDRRTSAASALLIWEAISFAATVTRTFDFEGSMIEPIEKFFRAFGARQVPYFRITKLCSLRMRISNDIRRWIRVARTR